MPQFILKRLDSCRPIFRNQKILTVPSIYIMQCAIYVYKNKTDFIRNDQVHPYPTRNRTNFVTPKHSTSSYEKSPYISCVKVYNQLPTMIKEALTFTTLEINSKYSSLTTPSTHTRNIWILTLNLNIYLHPYFLISAFVLQCVICNLLFFRDICCNH